MDVDAGFEVELCRRLDKRIAERTMLRTVKAIAYKTRLVLFLKAVYMTSNAIVQWYQEMLSNSPVLYLKDLHVRVLVSMNSSHLFK